MPMVRALQKMYYDKRDRLPGEVYRMDDREDFNILCALGKIEVVKEEKANPVPHETASMKSEEPAAPPETEIKPKPSPQLAAEKRRVYRRRDMRPQE